MLIYQRVFNIFNYSEIIGLIWNPRRHDRV